MGNNLYLLLYVCHSLKCLPKYFADREDRIPDRSVIMWKANDFADKILEEMICEPCVSDLALRIQKYLQWMQTRTVVAEWGDFLSHVVSTLMKILTMRTKILPMEQHAEIIKEVNKILSSDAEVSMIREKLKNIGEFNSSSDVLNVVIYRFVTKMCDKLEVFIIQCRRQNDVNPDEPESVQVCKFSSIM